MLPTIKYKYGISKSIPSRILIGRAIRMMHSTFMLLGTPAGIHPYLGQDQLESNHNSGYTNKRWMIGM